MYLCALCWSLTYVLDLAHLNCITWLFFYFNCNWIVSNVLGRFLCTNINLCINTVKFNQWRKCISSWQDMFFKRIFVGFNFWARLGLKLGINYLTIDKMMEEEKNPDPLMSGPSQSHHDAFGWPPQNAGQQYNLGDWAT